MIVVGVGVEPGTPAENLAAALAGLGLDPEEIDVVATVDDRAAEPAVTAVAQRRVLRTYPYAALAAVEVPNPSEVVRRLTGSGSVAEAAALLAARELGNGCATLVVEKRRGAGVTVAAARPGAV